MSNHKSDQNGNSINIKDIKINDEYKRLVPPLTNQEYNLLKSSIKKNGRNTIPIIVNQSGTVLEGHHRLKACLELGLKPRRRK